MDLLAAPIAMLVMPVMGSVSDYTSSRWGRRKPFILFGSLTSAVALAGLALAPTFLVLLAFFLVLQLTSNVARGPFAGLVPDLVPERQVGIASGLMGMMIMLGLVAGYLIIWSGYLLGTDFTLPLLALAALVGLTGVGTFLWIPNGPPPKPRAGRSWRSVALETFGRDILEQRSYLFLLGSRFFLLMGGGFFMNINVLYLEGARSPALACPTSSAASASSTAARSSVRPASPSSAWRRCLRSSSPASRCSAWPTARSWRSTGR
jgi:MFS family permease